MPSCKNCGIEFVATRSWHRYCSTRCQLSAQGKRSYKIHRAKILAKVKAYRSSESVKKHIKNYVKNYTDKNREKIAKNRKIYYETHKEAIKVNRKERNRINSHNLRIKQRGINGKALSIRVMQQVYEDNIKKYGTLTCVLCNKAIVFGDDNIEHLTPIARGGTNAYENLAIAHAHCNKRKNVKTLEEWQVMKNNFVEV